MSILTRPQRAAIRTAFADGKLCGDAAAASIRAILDALDEMEHDRDSLRTDRDRLEQKALDADIAAGDRVKAVGRDLFTYDSRQKIREAIIGARAYGGYDAFRDVCQIAREALASIDEMEWQRDEARAQRDITQSISRLLDAKARIDHVETRDAEIVRLRGHIDVYERQIARLESREVAIQAERNAAFSRANVLHRRAQAAEAIVARSGIVEGRPQGDAGRSLGRALANYAAAEDVRERDEARELIKVLWQVVEHAPICPAGPRDTGPCTCYVSDLQARVDATIGNKPDGESP